MKTKHNSELVQHAIDGLQNISEDSVYGADLHHELFNTDYFIIGRYEAKEWLESNVGIFEAIEEIKEYEQSNFGEVSTDLSEPEKVVNMYAYIKGEEILNTCNALSNNWDNYLSKEDIEAITEELNELI